jgi:hypothetical protein
MTVDDRLATPVQIIGSSGWAAGSDDRFDAGLRGVLRREGHIEGAEHTTQLRHAIILELLVLAKWRHVEVIQAERTDDRRLIEEGVFIDLLRVGAIVITTVEVDTNSRGGRRWRRRGQLHRTVCLNSVVQRARR